jgi:hypothetical protein
MLFWLLWGMAGGESEPGRRLRPRIRALRAGLHPDRANGSELVVLCVPNGSEAGPEQKKGGAPGEGRHPERGGT